MDLSNKTVLLTGASGGIGRAIAQQLVAAGCKLMLVDQNEAGLEELSEQLPGQQQLYIANLTDTQQRSNLIHFCEHETAGIDIVINAAGCNEFAFAELETGNIERFININLSMPMMLIQGLLPQLKKRPKAIILNIGSTFGSIGFPGYTSYCASKFGLRGYTEALRRELSDTNISVLYFAPRATKTSINSSAVDDMNVALKNSIDTAESVAKNLLTQLQNESRHCFVGWPEKLFVRINSILPALVENAIKKQLPIIQKYHQRQNQKRN
jgi:short-subunit dehydrogenase